MVPCGIPNLGQTCYAASVLQCLRSLSMKGPWNHSSVSSLVKNANEPGDAHEFLMAVMERWNVLDRLVSGTYIVRTLCTRCRTARMSKDPFSFIRNTRDPPETLEGYACSTCATQTRARRANRFWKVPRVIVGLGPHFTGIDSFETKDVHGNYVYDRKGFVVYIPGKLHYVAIVRRGMSWFLCDDASVRKISGVPPSRMPFVTMTLYELTSVI
jgi:hypothetical protein